ncbi:MAG: serine hydrolase [Pseudomonadota bacterium]
MAHKRGLLLGLGLSAAFLASAAGTADAAKTKQGPPSVAVTSAIDFSSGTILIDQNLDRRIVPASITKMMTFMVTLDDIRAGTSSWNDTIKVSHNAGTRGFSEGFTPGTHHTLDTLMRASLARSNNRAATAMAEHGANGSMSRFVARMNQKAQDIGMTHTLFVDASGLSASNRSTARDLLLMGRYFVATYPEYIDLLGQREYRGQENTNKLLYHNFGNTGIQTIAGKTGTHSSSGSCLLAIARRGDDFVIALSMGAPNRFVRDARLSNAIINAFDRQFLLQTHPLAHAPTIGAAIDVPLSLHQSAPVTIPVIQQATAALTVNKWPSYRMTGIALTRDLTFDFTPIAANDLWGRQAQAADQPPVYPAMPGIRNSGTERAAQTQGGSSGSVSRATPLAPL